jgi:hypothetical protein
MESHLDVGSRIIGHHSSSEYWELSKWHPAQLEFCQAEQMIAGTHVERSPFLHLLLTLTEWLYLIRNVNNYGAYIPSSDP